LIPKKANEDIALNREMGKPTGAHAPTVLN